MTTHPQYIEKRPRHIVEDLIVSERLRRDEFIRQRDEVHANPALGDVEFDIYRCDENILFLEMELAQ